MLPAPLAKKLFVGSPSIGNPCSKKQSLLGLASNISIIKNSLGQPIYLVLEITDLVFLPSGIAEGLKRIESFSVLSYVRKTLYNGPLMNS